MTMTLVTCSVTYVGTAVILSLLSETCLHHAKETSLGAGLVPLGVKCACTCAGDGEVFTCVNMSRWSTVWWGRSGCGGGTCGVVCCRCCGVVKALRQKVISKLLLLSG